MRVFVYYNLHRHCWSVKCTERGHPDYGRVIAHQDTIHLADVEFKVSEAGRQRVLRERKKNVHAGVQGYIASNLERVYQDGQVTYNPYRFSSFVRADTLEPIEKASGVMMHRGHVYLARVS